MRPFSGRKEVPTGSLQSVVQYLSLGVTWIRPRLTCTMPWLSIASPRSALLLPLSERSLRWAVRGQVRVQGQMRTQTRHEEKYSMNFEPCAHGRAHMQHGLS